MTTPVMTYRWAEPESWTLATYERTEGYAALRTALTMDPDAIIAMVKDVGPARPRRRGLPDRHEVGLHPAGRRQAALPRGQRRRGRARHLQGRAADDGRPALADRGHHHRLVRGALPSRLHLPARRAGARRPPAAGRDRRGVRRRLPRRQHPRQRLRPEAHPAPRRRRLHLRRGDGAARLARGLPRPAAAAPAVPGHPRALPVADGGQQRRVHRHACRGSSARASSGSARWAPRSRPARRWSRSAATSSGPASTRCRSARPCARCSTWPAGCATAPSSRPGPPAVRAPRC